MAAGAEADAMRDFGAISQMPWDSGLATRAGLPKRIATPLPSSRDQAHHMPTRRSAGAFRLRRRHGDFGHEPLYCWRFRFSIAMS